MIGEEDVYIIVYTIADLLLSCWQSLKATIATAQAALKTMQHRC